MNVRLQEIVYKSAYVGAVLAVCLFAPNSLIFTHLLT